MSTSGSPKGDEPSSPLSALAFQSSSTKHESHPVNITNQNLMTLLVRNRLDRHECKCDVQKIHSANLGIDFTVNIQNDGVSEVGACHVITIHDIGTSHTQFHDFTNDPVCELLRKRIVWIHVDLPGQEDNSLDLNIKKYPSLTELARELIVVVDSANLKQAILMGDGLGANIAVRFAMLYPERCYGLILLRPTSTGAGIWETMKDRYLNWRLSTKGMSSEIENYLLWYKFNETRQSVQEATSRRRYSVSGPLTDSLRVYLIQEFKEMLYKKRNPKNLARLFTSFLNRENIEDEMDLIKCDVLTVAGRESALYHTTEKFYDRFRTSRIGAGGDCVRRMENSPFLAFDNVTDIILEVPEKLANIMQLFLQGLGLISGMPLSQCLPGLGRHHRSLSMDIADAPSPRFLQYRKSTPH